MIRYTFELGRRSTLDRSIPASREVSIQLPRPEWWPDATQRQRRSAERAALGSPELQQALAEGFIVSHVRRPVCACAVQQVPAHLRDSEYRGASGTCNRCGGPLPY